MTESSDPNKRSDFTSRNFIERNQHNRDIGGLRKRLEDLEARVGTNEAFGKSFALSQENSTVLNTAVKKVIDDYDKHLLIVKGTALGKWLLVLILGAVIGWIVNQVFTSTQSAAEIESLKRQLESYEKKPGE
jgi:hypothetical protein